ncbi:MAG: hypothetical protein IKQ46_09530 [Bacteroidales bacterium]|nr:hypothetical protein [Bacteroidales bacterium]
MITLSKKSLVKLSNLEALYFTERALVAVEQLPEEIRNGKLVKELSRCYETLCVNIETMRTNPQTIELVGFREQVDLLFKALTSIVFAQMYHPDESVVQKAGAAKEILCKYKILRGNNLFKRFSKYRCQIDELEKLGDEVLKTLNIDAYIVAAKALLEKHNALYEERGSYAQSIKGMKKLARNDLNVAWSKLVDFIEFYNVYVAPESCDEFMLIVNELFSKCKKRQFDNSAVISNS